MAPAGTPQDIVDKLAAATAKAVANPEVVAASRTQGITARGGGPEELRRYVESEIAK